MATAKVAGLSIPVKVLSRRDIRENISTSANIGTGRETWIIRGEEVRLEYQMPSAVSFDGRGPWEFEGHEWLGSGWSGVGDTIRIYLTREFPARLEK